MKKNGNVTENNSKMSHLKKARKKAGLTQAQVSEKLQTEFFITCSRDNIANYESGRRIPGKALIEALSVIYDAFPEYLTEEIPWPAWDDFYIDKAQREDEYIQSAIVPFVTFYLKNAGVILDADKELSAIQEISMAIYGKQCTENGYTQEVPVSIDKEIIHFMYWTPDGKLIQKAVRGKELISDIYHAFRTSHLLARDFQKLVSKL